MAHSEHDDRVPSTSSELPIAEESVGQGNVQQEFVCDICGLTAPFETFSKNVPDRGVTKKIKYREKCYITRDPFHPPNERLPLVVGAPCSGKSIDQA